MLLLLADSPPPLPAGLTARGERLPIGPIAAGDGPACTELRRRLADPGVLVLVDATEAVLAEAAARRLDGAVWIALLPAGGAEAEAETWWQRGAFDAIAHDDAATLERALRRAAAQGQRTGAPTDETGAMRAALHAMQASLDNIPAPIFAKNAEGIYTGCNRAFVDYLGLPREQIVGKTVYDVAPPQLAAVYDQADRKLLASGGRQVYEAQVKWADGSLRDVIFHKAVFRDAQGQVAGQAGAIFDITDRKRLEHGLRELAQTDPLTGLLNRRSFIERASAALDEARTLNAPLTVLLFDIDHFKQINDTHGHAAGDAMLCHLARIGRQQLRSDDLMARIGGDEFAILLGPGAGDAGAVAARLPACVSATPLQFEGRELRCAISLGAAIVIADDHDVDSALRQADAALYEAKRQGRARAVVFGASV
ncbi:diguanylate cyclase [Ideonella sp.]|uniref:GGDEF domain-containing protein n=1 Tax=Ideonella sp. TaxID=1929293 RepID=UPI002B48A7E7|nr:diguanylate cyclase [Ideonella sp.]HJV71415.1 diguanylate cyclase [Ideonella sp.]